MRWIVGFYLMGLAVAILGDSRVLLACISANLFALAGLTVLPPFRRYLARETDWRVLAFSTPVTLLSACTIFIAHIASA